MRTIIRSGYVQHRKTKRITVHRKGGKTYTYTRKAGTTRVRPVPTKDVGAIGKGPKVIGPLKAGMLTRYHYHPVEAPSTRHKALSPRRVQGTRGSARSHPPSDRHQHADQADPAPRVPYLQAGRCVGPFQRTLRMFGRKRSLNFLEISNMVPCGTFAGRGERQPTIKPRSAPTVRRSRRSTPTTSAPTVSTCRHFPE
jgi:hypothetical protein